MGEATPSYTHSCVSSACSGDISSSSGLVRRQRVVHGHHARDAPVLRVLLRTERTL